MLHKVKCIVYSFSKNWSHSMDFSSYSTCRGVFESQWKYALNIFNRNEKYWNLEKFYHKTYLSELDHATTFDMLKIHWIVTIWWFPNYQLCWSHVCDIGNCIILFFHFIIQSILYLLSIFVKLSPLWLYYGMLE